MRWCGVVARHESCATGVGSVHPKRGMGGGGRAEDPHAKSSVASEWIHHDSKIVNFLERVTGADLDGDGDVGLEVGQSGAKERLNRQNCDLPMGDPSWEPTMCVAEVARYAAANYVEPASIIRSEAQHAQKFTELEQQHEQDRKKRERARRAALRTAAVAKADPLPTYTPPPANWHCIPEHVRLANNVLKAQAVLAQAEADAAKLQLIAMQRRYLEAEVEMSSRAAMILSRSGGDEGTKQMGSRSPLPILTSSSAGDWLIDFITAPPSVEGFRIGATSRPLSDRTAFSYEGRGAAT